jgi:glycosyltransferase involved in cell wall biosynthesis
MPAISHAWLPWIPSLGTSISTRSLALLRQQAARVLLPSSFHAHSLVALRGLPQELVAVVPQPIPPEDWCPADFQALEGRQALEQLLLAEQSGVDATRIGRAGSSSGVILLHQAPAAWQYGATALLEAYASSFTAADNATLVLQLLPPGEDDEREEVLLPVGQAGAADGSTSSASSQGSRPAWDIFTADLQQQVQRLRLEPTAPRMVLLSWLPRLGRWADRVLHAADAVVLPYLGGTAGRELVRAASCGKALVTTAGGPAADLLTSDATAWLAPGQLGPCRMVAVPPAPQGSRGGSRLPLGCMQVSPADLGAALRQAYSDAASRQQRGAAARQAAQRAAAETGWDALAGRLWQHVQAHLPQPDEPSIAHPASHTTI